MTPTTTTPMPGSAPKTPHRSSKSTGRHAAHKSQSTPRKAIPEPAPDPERLTVPAPYLNTPVAPNAWRRPYLESRIKTGSDGSRTVTFGPGEYCRGYEKFLQDMKIDVVVITNPTTWDRTLFTPEHGYFFKPEKVTWRNHVKPFEKYLEELPDGVRDEITTNLEMSASLKVTTGDKPLSLEDFGELYALQERTTLDSAEFEGTRLDKNWARRKKLRNYRFLSMKDRGGLLGGAILQCDARNLNVTITHAAYDPAYREKAMETRVFAEVMKYAQKNGYRTVTYGEDNNLYRPDLNSELLEAKAGLGFVPDAGDAQELVKVLNPAALNGDVLFFEGSQEEGLSLRRLCSEQPSIPIKAPNGIRIDDIPFPAVDLDEPLPNAIDLAAAMNALEPGQATAVAEKIWEAIQMVSPSTRKFPEGQSVPALIDRILYITERDVNGDFILSCARSLGLSLSNSQSLVESRGISDFLQPQVYLKLAAALGADWYPEDLTSVLQRVALAAECPHSIFNKVSLTSSGQMAATFLTAAANAGKLPKVLQCLNAFIPLQPLLSTHQNIESVQPLPILTHITLEELDLSAYLKPDKIEEGLSIAARLHGLMMSRASEFWRVPTYNYNVDSIGAAVTLRLRDFMNPDTAGRDLEIFDRHALNDCSNLKQIHLMIGRLAELCEPLTRPMADGLSITQVIQGSDIRFIILQGYLPYFLLRCGIAHDAIDPWGKSESEILQDIDARASTEQKLSILSFLEGISSSTSTKSDIAKLRDALTVNSRDQPLQRTQLPARSEGLGDLATTWNALDGLFPAHCRHRCKHLFSTATALGLNLHARENPIVEELLAQMAVQSHRLGLTSKECSIESIKEALLRAETQVASETLLELAYYHPTFDLTPDDWRKLSTHLTQSTEPEISLSRLLVPVRALTNDATAEYAANVLRTIPSTTFIMFHTREQRQDLFRFLSDIPLTPQQAHRLETELGDLQARLTTEHPKDSSCSENNCELLWIIGDILRLDQAPFIEEFLRYSEVNSDGAISALHDMAFKLGDADPTSRRQLAMAVLARNLPHAGVYRSRPQLSQNFSPFAPHPWKSTDFDTPNASIVGYMRARLLQYHVSTSELDDFVPWMLSKSSLLDDGFALAVRHLSGCSEDVRQQSIEAITTKLQQVPFASVGAYRSFVQEVHDLDPAGRQGLREKWFANREFIENHPWHQYGYGTDTCNAVRKFCDDENFSRHRAEMIAGLLMTHNDDQMGRFYVESLVNQAPGQDFDNLAHFVRYWLSLPTEDQVSFVKARIDDSLTSARLAVSRKTNEATIANLETQAQKAGISDEARAKIQGNIRRTQDYLELFKVQRDSAADPKTREAAQQALNTRLLTDYPPALNPEVEEQKLIEQQAAKFAQMLASAGGDEGFRQEWLTQNAPLLKNSGIIERLVQFSSFADEKGKQMLQILLDAYADPDISRIVTVNHPERGGDDREHFDYFGKFTELQAALTQRGVPENDVNGFLGHWQRLWHISAPVQSEAREGTSYLAVTHDFEEWCKHGEQPQISCQRLSSDSYLNADGRPLARILLPQLKLAQIYHDNTLVARAVVEVTVHDTDNGPELALLVEYLYGDRAHQPTLRQTVRDYARSTGIKEENIWFAGDRGYPKPLTEDFCIYRDFFQRERSQMA